MDHNVINLVDNSETPPDAHPVADDLSDLSLSITDLSITDDDDSDDDEPSRMSIDNIDNNIDKTTNDVIDLLSQLKKFHWKHSRTYRSDHFDTDVFYKHQKTINHYSSHSQSLLRVLGFYFRRYTFIRNGNHALVHRPLPQQSIKHNNQPLRLYMDPWLTPEEWYLLTRIPWTRSNKLFHDSTVSTSTITIDQTDMKKYVANDNKLSLNVITYYMGIVYNDVTNYNFHNEVLCLPANYLDDTCNFRPSVQLCHILFPYLFNGHWYLIYFNVPNNVCRIFDSHNGFENPALGILHQVEGESNISMILQKMMTKLVSDRPDKSSTFNFTNIQYQKVEPQQTDNNSCGVYVAYIAQALVSEIMSSKNLEYTFSIDQSTVAMNCPSPSEFRKQMILECYRGELYSV